MRENFTITQLVNYIKQQLSNDFILKNITVTGEIGNFTNHFSGHWYFSLKDEKSLINCCMFKGYNSYLNFVPSNSDTVVVTGNINVFEKNGQLQLIVTTMQQSGSGNFYKQFELTKQKLEPLGYFDLKNKKQVKKFNYKVAVVTGANTAALQDIKRTISLRWPLMEIIECNAIVQGQQAISSIIDALKLADSLSVDVIILARGGGSVDDLWCFNDERIAKTIYECNTPVVTGIGHEIDTTIADLVADVRCATPTAAATYISANLIDVLNQFKDYQNNISNYFVKIFNNKYQLLDYYNSKLTSYKVNIDNQIIKLDSFNAFISNLLTKKIDLMKYSLSNNQLVLSNLIESKMAKKEIQLNNQISLLDSLSPLKTMSRGYIISKQNNKVVRRAQQIDYNRVIELNYVDGTIEVKAIKR